LQIRRFHSTPRLHWASSYPALAPQSLGGDHAVHPHPADGGILGDVKQDLCHLRCHKGFDILNNLGLSLALTQAEVAEMLEALEEKDHRGLSPSDVAIMPRDLAAPVSKETKENAAFVRKKTRRALLARLKQARKRGGREIKPEAWKGFLASVAL
jgi:hypothetical protein